MKNMLSLKEQLTMSSTEIAELTGKRHDNVLADIRKMLAELDILTPDFSGVYKDQRLIERPCFNLPKDLTLTLVSGYSVQLRKRIIDRWLELEASASPVMTLEQMTLAVIQGQQQKIAAMEAQALLDKPKVKFAEVVTESGNTRCIRVWVKSMKHENNLIVGERAVFKWLLDNRYIFKEGNGYLPYAKYESNGLNYFTVVIDDINGKPRRMLKITGKGVVALTGKVVEYFCGNEFGMVPA